MARIDFLDDAEAAKIAETLQPAKPNGAPASELVPGKQVSVKGATKKVTDDGQPAKPKANRGRPKKAVAVAVAKQVEPQQAHASTRHTVSIAHDLGVRLTRLSSKYGAAAAEAGRPEIWTVQRLIEKALLEMLERNERKTA